MTLISWDGGKPVLKDGKIGAEQGCCCQGPCTCTDCRAFKLFLNNACIYQDYNSRLSDHPLSRSCGPLTGLGQRPLFDDDCKFEESLTNPGSEFPAFCFPPTHFLEEGQATCFADFCDSAFLDADFSPTRGDETGPPWFVVEQCDDVPPLLSVDDMLCLSTTQTGDIVELNRPDPDPDAIKDLADDWSSVTCKVVAWPCVCCDGSTVKVRVYGMSIVRHLAEWWLRNWAQTPQGQWLDLGPFYCVRSYAGDVWYRDYEGPLPNCVGSVEIPAVGERVYPDYIETCTNDQGSAYNWDGGAEGEPAVEFSCPCEIDDTLTLQCVRPNCFGEEDNPFP